MNMNRVTSNERGDATLVVLVIVSIAVVIIGIATMMFVIPKWNVWRAGLQGEALKLKADQTKQILVTQAQAELDAAGLRAQAIEKIGAMAQKYPEYRKQEFIGAFAEALHEGNIHQIIYVPTEGNIPITEATRISK